MEGRREREREKVGRRAMSFSLFSLFSLFFRVLELECLGPGGKVGHKQAGSPGSIEEVGS